MGTCYRGRVGKVITIGIMIKWLLNEFCTCDIATISQFPQLLYQFNTIYILKFKVFLTFCLEHIQNVHISNVLMYGANIALIIITNYNFGY